MICIMLTKIIIFSFFKVGEKLGKFEVEKRRAVEMENFDLAKSKKVYFILVIYYNLKSVFHNKEHVSCSNLCNADR